MNENIRMEDKLQQTKKLKLRKSPHAVIKNEPIKESANVQTQLFIQPAKSNRSQVMARRWVQIHLHHPRGWL